MSKFHVNPTTGDPGKCSAKEGNCPFGADAPHFASRAEAAGEYGRNRGSFGPEPENGLPEGVTVHRGTYIGGNIATVRGVGGNDLGNITVRDGFYVAGFIARNRNTGGHVITRPATLGTFATEDEAIGAILTRHGMKFEENANDMADLKPASYAKALENKYPGLELTLMESSSGYTILDGIKLPKEQRKTGAGTAIMEELVATADKAGWPLALTPSTDWGATSVARLEKFYGRFGFVKNRGRNKDFTIMQSMIRPPSKDNSNG